MEPIAVSDVRKAYGPVTALRGVDLELRPGDVHCLAGPNGSGKTTLLRLLGGLARPTSGRVAVPDVETGYAFQRPNVYPDLTVAENLDVFGDLRAADADWRAELVDRLRLDAALHRRADDLSDGFSKKLDLALALLAKPDLLLLDEPLADLDDLTVARLVALVDDYRAPDRLVVVSTHNVDRFAAVLDRLTVVLDGALVYDDGTDGTDPQVTYERVLGEHASDPGGP